MNNQQRIELIILMIERLNQYSYDLVQNTDLINNSEHYQDLIEISECLNHSCDLLQIINQPLFENDKKLFLLC
jgi:hypothetical protein